MCESLARHCKDFQLFIFAFDQVCYDALQRLNLRNVTVIRLSQFEDKELLSVKPKRSRAEYCWTCTPSVILYVLEKYNVDMCTYLDADIYFFASPKSLLKEINDKAILITEHRFTPAHDRTETSGKYNVQFLSFRNNTEGVAALKWWRKKCIASCELKPEEKKCGDQKYLDDWLTRFEKVHVLEHLGGGVAPWNVQQYQITQANSKIYGKEHTSGKVFELIFYHFHGLKMTKTGGLQLSGSEYRIEREVVEHIYAPYVFHLEKVKTKMLSIDFQFDPHGLGSELTVPGASPGALRRLVEMAFCIDQQFCKNNFNVGYKLRNFMKRFGKHDTLA